MASYNIKALGVYNEHLDHVGDALLVEDGIIKGLGTASYAKDINVEGYVTPAFVDAHLHISWLGLALQGVDLSGVQSPEALARSLARSRGEIAYGRGWDQERFSPRGALPTRRLLDQYVPDKPAIAVRTCGHMAVLNTLALETTSVHRRFPRLIDPETGVAKEDAVYAAVELLFEKVDLTSLVREAVTEIRRNGIAGVSSMACPVGEARALATLERRGDLGIRVACYPREHHLESIASLLAGGRKSRVVGVKDFADGSLGARTAYLSEDYSDDSGNRGLGLLDSRDIVGLARRVLDKGLRLAIHAIGDAALEHVIEAYEEVGVGERGRIEHASIAPPKLIERLAGLGSFVVVQPHFRVSDWWVEDRLGRGRARWAYPFKTMARAGVRLALSTDAPVETLNPLETIKAAESRCGEPACRAEEALSRRETFYYYTRASALASGGPVATLGSLEKGSPAELIWFKDDPASSSELGPPMWVLGN